MTSRYEGASVPARPAGKRWWTIGLIALALGAGGDVRAQAPLQPDPPRLDLAALLWEAEANSPDVAAALSRRAASVAVPSQTEALPDPIAGVSYTNAGLTEWTLGEDPDSMLTLSWMQEVPHSSKRRLASDAVSRETEVLSRRADLVRLALASRIKQQYAALYRIDRAASILETNRQILESFLRTARIRYETGEGLLENVLKAQTEVAVLDVQLVRLAQERLSVEADINRLVGRSSPAPLGVASVLPPVVPPGSDETAQLEAEALAHAPEVLAVEAEVRRGEARLEASRGLAKPDFLWGAGFGYREDLDPQIMGSFGMRLPVYEKRKQAQGIVQSAAELDASRLDAASMRLSVAAETRDLAAQAARAAAILKLYDDSVIPQARSALDSAAASYGVGRIDFKTLLDDFGALLRYQIDRETQRAEQVAALAGLERLTGRVLVPVEGAPRDAGTRTSGPQIKAGRRPAHQARAPDPRTSSGGEP